MNFTKLFVGHHAWQGAFSAFVRQGMVRSKNARMLVLWAHGDKDSINLGGRKVYDGAMIVDHLRRVLPHDLHDTRTVRAGGYWGAMPIVLMACEAGDYLAIEIARAARRPVVASRVTVGYFEASTWPDEETCVFALGNHFLYGDWSIFFPSDAPGRNAGPARVALSCEQVRKVFHVNDEHDLFGFDADGGMAYLPDAWG